MLLIFSVTIVKSSVAETVTVKVFEVYFINIGLCITILAYLPLLYMVHQNRNITDLFTPRLHEMKIV
ncbi:hypothetical protein NARC_10100 [Candidatus Nitrosocosmicus arcticus]|uniref:Uncharacterized protein n=1 Tax=Candidatus Nitrosocosmicus arcticus TaxID=2035267 RepID=A0A557SYL4_9ARCH|nr:hypothetical protein NARC_10100 [Candidatus Nitrosocosmicus arcticus]